MTNDVDAHARKKSPFSCSRAVMHLSLLNTLGRNPTAKPVVIMNGRDDKVYFSTIAELLILVLETTGRVPLLH